MKQTYAIKRTCGRISDYLCQMWEGNDLPTFALGRQHPFDDRAVAERVMWRLEANYPTSHESLPYFPARPLTYELVSQTPGECNE